MRNSMKLHIDKTITLNGWSLALVSSNNSRNNIHSCFGFNLTDTVHIVSRQYVELSVHYWSVSFQSSCSHCTQGPGGYVYKYWLSLAIAPVSHRAHRGKEWMDGWMQLCRTDCASDMHQHWSTPAGDASI